MVLTLPGVALPGYVGHIICPRFVLFLNPEKIELEGNSFLFNGFSCSIGIMSTNIECFHDCFLVPSFLISIHIMFTDTLQNAITTVNTYNSHPLQGTHKTSRLIQWWGNLYLRFVPPVGHKNSPQLGAVGSATRNTLWEAAGDL
jgi:hypothetical protein